MKNTIEGSVDSSTMMTKPAQGCGEVLAPIPGERWVCVAAVDHERRDHIAEDGTQW